MDNTILSFCLFRTWDGAHVSTKNKEKIIIFF